MSEILLNILVVFLFVFAVFHPLFLSDFRWYAPKKEHCDKGGVHKWVPLEETSFACKHWLCHDNERVYKHKKCKKCNEIKDY